MTLMEFVWCNRYSVDVIIGNPFRDLKTFSYVISMVITVMVRD